MIDNEDLKKMLSMKISNWESIPYSVGINCPNPECDNKGYLDDSRNILGWCETIYGYMFVAECKKCFSKYRFHGISGDRYNFKNFANSFLMSYMLNKKNEKQNK